MDLQNNEPDTTAASDLPERRDSSAVASIRRRVLFAFLGEWQPVVALKRAAALSRAFNAELHVLRVLPRGNLRASSLEVADIAAAMREATALQLTRAWLGCALGDRVGSLSLEIRTGSFVEHAAQAASELHAELIVVPPQEGPFGTLVTSLARAAGVPVFVARESTSGGVIVAATDLEDGEYRVLRKAAEMADRLGARLVAVHDVAPPAMVSNAGDAASAAAAAIGGPPDARRAQLALVSGRLCVDTETVMANEMSVAAVVLREARARDADVVVVGTRQKFWLGRLITSGGVAAQIVNRARRSVLVTPLDGDRGAPTRAPSVAFPSELRRHPKSI